MSVGPKRATRKPSRLERTSKNAEHQVLDARAKERMVKRRRDARKAQRIKNERRAEKNVP